MSRIAAAPAVWVALISCAASAALFFMFSRHKPHAPSYARGILVFGLLIGTLTRWILIWHTPGNYDMASWRMAADIFTSGGNIYLESTRYHYSPLWFWMLGWVNHASESFTLISFPVMLRLFLTAADIGTALVLWTWPRIAPWDRTQQALFFYLNPVSFLLTGAQGQFENVSIFFLVLALRLASPAVVEQRARRFAWFWATLAFVLKQNVLSGLIVVTCHVFRGMRALKFLAVSIAVFLATFSVYWQSAFREIYKNVFQYRSYAMPYGLAAFGDHAGLSTLFAIALASYSFRLRDRGISTKLLLGALFFLTFTPGFGVQYLVLPVAFGAIRPTRGFFIFTAVASAHLLGSYYNLEIRAFSWVPLWAVWASAAYWWFSVHSQPAKTS